MAGVAGDLDFVLEMGFVDSEFHLNHFSRGLLFFFVVFVPVVFDVAELALDAPGAGNELHGGDKLVGGPVFKEMRVFELLGGGLCHRRQFLGWSQVWGRENANAPPDRWFASFRR